MGINLVYTVLELARISHIELPTQYGKYWNSNNFSLYIFITAWRWLQNAVETCSRQVYNKH
jgi:hypothetical protein